MNYKIIGILAAIILVVLFAVPIDSNYSDVYVKLKVSKPLVGDAKISDYQIETREHTILQIPLMSQASILGSGTLKAQVSTETRSVTKSLGEIWRSSSDSYTIVFPKVPVSDSELHIQLFEDGAQVDEQVVGLLPIIQRQANI